MKLVLSYETSKDMRVIVKLSKVLAQGEASSGSSLLAKGPHPQHKYKVGAENIIFKKHKAENKLTPICAICQVSKQRSIIRRIRPLMSYDYRFSAHIKMKDAIIQFEAWII
jgi:hypothetical protein